MNLLIIECRGRVARVVEIPDGMDSRTVAVAWAKSEGWPQMPKDCKITTAPLTMFGDVLRRLMPCHEMDELEQLGKEIA